MFEFIDRHRRLVQIILALATVALVFTGQQMTMGMGKSDLVAKVGNKDISKAQFEQAVSKRIQQLSNQPTNVGKDLDTPELRAQILDQMINQALIDQAVEDEHLTVSETAVAKAVQSAPELRALPKTADGKFDVEAYKKMLAANHLTPAQFENEIQKQEVNAIMIASATASMGVLPNQLKALQSLMTQTRMIEKQTIDLAPYMAKVNVTPEQLQSYYQANQAKFTRPDLSDVEYALIPLLPENYLATDEDIKKALNAQTSADIAKARQDKNLMQQVFKTVADAKAQDVLKKLSDSIKKTPTDLNAVAKDMGGLVKTAQNVSMTGTLSPELQTTHLANPNVREVILRGEHVAAKTISNPVKANDFVLVVGKVTKQTPAGLQAFDDVKAEIEKILKTESAVADARKDYEQKLATMDTNKSLGTANLASIMQPQGLGKDTLAQVLSMPEGAPKLVLSNEKDQLELVRVLAKGAPLPDNPMIAQSVQQFWGDTAGALQLDAFMQTLRQHYDVKIYPEHVAAVKAAA